jgi:hypothetical protein
LFSQVHGPAAVNVHALLEALHRQGELLAIGAEVALLEARDEAPGRRAADPGAALPEPSAEVHMAVARVRLSEADACKFYLHTGTAALTLRTETL